MATQIPGVPPNIALINGPMLLGNLFGYGLYGVLVVQVFLYHSSFKRDPLWMRCLVYGVFFVDTIVTALGTVTAWDEMAGGWGDLNTLIWLDWPFNALPCLSGLVSSSVHFFFCWRIWKLTGSLLLPIPIACISLVQWAMASYCGITSVKIGVPRITELEPFVITWLGGSALVDILITVAMVTILFRAGSKSAFSQTNSVMAKLIKLTVETGMATTIGAVTELIFFLVFRTNNMHFIPFLMLAKLYSNTLLATLNSRAVFGANKARQPAALWDDDVSSGSRSTNSGHNVNKFSAAPGVVSITTTTERRNDLEMNDFSDSSLKGSWKTKPSYVDFDAPPPPPRKL